MVATAKRRERPKPPPVFGVYRCYHPHPVFPGRPCNKRLGAGSGEFQDICPRCHQPVAFLNPNDREG